MPIEHATIADPYRHEPKGISTAANGQVYVANGSGGGSWETPVQISEWIMEGRHIPAFGNVSNGEPSPNGDLFAFTAPFDFVLVSLRFQGQTGTGDPKTITVAVNGSSIASLTVPNSTPLTPFTMNLSATTVSAGQIVTVVKAGAGTTSQLQFRASEVGLACRRFI